jgi:hypothetical protein
MARAPYYAEKPHNMGIEVDIESAAPIYRSYLPGNLVKFLFHRRGGPSGCMVWVAGTTPKTKRRGFSSAKITRLGPFMHTA